MSGRAPSRVREPSGPLQETIPRPSDEPPPRSPTCCSRSCSPPCHPPARRSCKRSSKRCSETPALPPQLRMAAPNLPLPARLTRHGPLPRGKGRSYGQAPQFPGIKQTPPATIRTKRSPSAPFEQKFHRKISQLNATLYLIAWARPYCRLSEYQTVS